MLNPDPNAGAARVEHPSDELVLAALNRCARHRARDTSAVPVWAIFEHLDISRRSASARRVRIRLDVMHAAGWIALSRLHGIQSWELTSSGTRHLRRARRDGRVPSLPESPQHRAWRTAHTTAVHEIDRFARSLREHLDAAASLLAGDDHAHSDVWFALAESLQWECKRLGSATYCLREWSEPDDARADVDERLDPGEEMLDRAERGRLMARRAGRRNVRLWDDHRR